jgi:hypothetical protein
MKIAEAGEGFLGEVRWMLKILVMAGSLCGGVVCGGLGGVFRRLKRS